MTPEDIAAAINGAVVEHDGKTWTITVERTELTEPHAYAVHVRIAGLTEHRGTLVIGRGYTVPRRLRAIAVGAARGFLTGKTPPGGRVSLL